MCGCECSLFGVGPFIVGAELCRVRRSPQFDAAINLVMTERMKKNQSDTMPTMMRLFLQRAIRFLAFDSSAKRKIFDPQLVI